MDLQLQVSRLHFFHRVCGGFLELCDPSLSHLQHGAIRTTLSSLDDYTNDDESGFQRIEAREIDTLETGGWSTRELRTILRGLDGLHIVSADIVEVAPAYDTSAERNGEDTPWKGSA
ncbi:hypothetical protein H0H87_002687 [Tephrocybe sp. NHM501043]|nr:hypothetical protein H0H87_002687 [Tephrocybe sp. NHM501043]